MHHNAQPWRDTNNQLIQAHGGGLLHHGGCWYWYGENKSAPTYRQGEIDRADVVGISCYSSTDLVHWRNEGIVLPAVSDDPNHDLHPSKVAERPKVLHHAATDRFVMWLHVDTWNYLTAHAGVAVAESPTGPFRYLGSGKPFGHDSHDLTAFTDPDGNAWLIHSANFHKALHIVRLSADYLEPAELAGVEFVGARREAAAPFFYDGQWYMLTSGCTGWEPNAADIATAPRPEGPWRMLGNPCRSGVDPHLTWRCQSTFVAPNPTPGRFIAQFDRWSPQSLGESGYAWLPFDARGEATIIEWRDMYEG
jgi:hypothetical protein